MAEAALVAVLIGLPQRVFNCAALSLFNRQGVPLVLAAAARYGSHRSMRRTAVTSIGDTPTRIALRTFTTSPGWIVAGELDYPGWAAELDGTPLPIHRANGMFRAVCVPSGDHRLSFVFRPWDMVAYAWQRRK